jgi:tRNA nucleotidyltransferase (CCA-adding enzyme)
MWYKLASESHVPLHIGIPDSLNKILNVLKDNHLTALIVGGAVRDAMLGMEPKDIDVEVYGTNYEDLEATLKQVPGAFIDTIGKSFGIIKYRDADGMEYDFSVPRRESKAGIGHKGFDVEIDPTITPKEAASRRDFTINSLAYNPFTHEVLDFFGGVTDLKNKVLRHTSGAFAEDPLRVLRGMQFSARMGLKIAPETAALARSIMGEYSNLSKERIEREWDKLVQKGKTPGEAIQYLVDTGWVDLYPEIKNIIGVPQHNAYHPEGEVEAHTRHVMNEAAVIADREGLKGDGRSVLIYAALAHDFAKAHTTEKILKNGVEQWASHGHEKEGGPLAKAFLERLGVKKDIIDKVVPLVENHLAHITVNENTPNNIVRSIAERLYPATIQELLYLIEADHSGRPPLDKGLPSEALSLKNLAVQNDVWNKRITPLIQGRDIQEFNIPPGKMYGEIIQAARKAQLEGKINNKKEAKEWLVKILYPYVAILRGDDPIFQQYGIAGPDIGKILNAAFRAQLNGQFNDIGGAREFVKQTMEIK